MCAAGAAMVQTAAAGSRGYTLIELLLAAAVAATVLSMSVPLTTTAVDEIRSSMAARYLEGRIMNARMSAVKRSANVALRFEAVRGGYAFAEYLDGNNNGVRSAEIAAGIDTQLIPAAVSARAVSGSRVRSPREHSRHGWRAEHLRKATASASARAGS